jgi:hypothetical protein
MTTRAGWWTAVAAAIIWLGCHGSAGAQTTYTDRPSWAAAAGPVNTETFEGIASAGGFTAFDVSGGLPRTGVRYTGVVRNGAGYYLRVVDANYLTGYNWGSGAVLHGAPNVTGPQGEGGPGSWILVNPSVGSTAAGADIMSIVQYGSPMRIVVTTVDSKQYTYTVNTAAYPQRAFFGIVTPAPILSILFTGLQGFPVIDNFSFGGPGHIAAPTITTANVSGQTVTLAWTPPPTSGLPVTSYRIEAAATSWGTAFAVYPTTTTSLVAPGVPKGTYYLRIRSMSGTTQGPASSEVVLNVGNVCTGPPSAPTNATATASGSVVTVSWNASSSGCAPTQYVLRAGTQSGAADLGVFPVGLLTAVQGTLPPGTYFFSVIAQNGSAQSSPSNEAQVTVGGCTAPAAPANFTATSALDVVTFAWTPPAGAVTRYVLEVGSSSGAKDLATVPLTVPGLQVPGVPRGTYFVRVRAENACGVSAATAERALTVSY